MIPQVAAEAARRFEDRTAYVAADGWSVSFRDLHRLSGELATGLAARGVGRGDVIALALPACPEYAVAYLAAARLGAVTAGVNARLAAPERDAVVETASPRLVVATAELAPSDPPPGCEVVEVTPAHDVDGVVSELREPGVPVAGRGPNGLEPADRDHDPDDPVAIVFTSGTTGRPKGAVYTGRQLEFITRTDTGGRWGGGGAMLAGTSLAHLAFMTKFPGRLMSGAPTFFTDRWRAADALAMVAEHRMSRLGGIPTQVALMLRDPAFDDYDLSCVELVVIGGGPATPALVREARERFGAPVLVRYSCTEAGVGTGTSIDDPPEDAEVSVGRPQPGVELRIDPTVDGAGGGVGEVCLRSPGVMAHYHRDPDATGAALTPDGFVRTGDLGWIDGEGRLRLAGRTREMYVRGGYNVYPIAVEQVLAQHPGVADVAVAPRPDDVMGEVGVAVVVPRDAGSPPALDDLRAFAADRLARHELPEDVVVTGDLPLTAMDKLDRRALATLVQTARGSRPPARKEH